MNLPTTFARMSRNDVRLIGRDSFLSGMLAYILIVCLILRFGLPALATTLAANTDIVLVDWYPMLVAYIAIMMGSVLAGVIIGFLLLDERDDNTIKALLVTPMPFSTYVTYRVLAPALLAFVVIIADVLIINVTAMPLWQLALIAAGGALIAPLATLFLAAFADNKVQGFALLKIVGTSGVLIALAWFVAEPLQFLFGLFPPYWIAKAFWDALAGGTAWPLFLGIGVVYLLMVTLMLARRFQMAAYK